MQNLSNLLPTTESKHSSDNRPFAVKQAERSNAVVGHLNEDDGIDCPVCKNKGIIYIADEDNPVLSQAPCKCMAKRNAIGYMKRSGLESLLEHRVATFEINEYWQGEVKKLATTYVQGAHTAWFCLLGQSGAGKTHICSAIAKTFLDRGIETKYVVWNTFIRELKEDNLTDKQMMYRFCRVPVLYIDDFLKGRYTDTDVTLAFDLLNYRYNNKLTTIITSELSFTQLMGIDGAIAGRIKERANGFLFEISKDDKKNYRLK